MTESDIGKLIQMKVSDQGGRLFRYPVGLYYTAKGTPIKIGTPGISDFLGWLPLVITSEMIGKTVAQFIAYEIKKPKHKTKKERLKKQLNFIELVNKSGGIGRIIDA